MREVQLRLVDLLKQKCSSSGQLVQELMELLSLSQDSIYRRLRGDSDFTLYETQLLANNYDLSIDSILHKDVPSTNFRFNKLYNQEDAFMNYVAGLTQQMKLLSKANGKLTFIASELPISQSFQNQGLREFKIYYWLKVVLNRPSLKGVKFDEYFGLGININEQVNSLMQSYANMQKLEIWTEETLDDTIRQLCYCRDSGLLEPKMINLVCKSMLDMLDRLEGELEMQSDANPKNKLTFYVSSVELGNNVILMDFGSHRSAFVKFNTFNTVSTQNEEFCDEIQLMINSNLTKCVEISGKSDIHRHQFFTVLRDKVNILYDSYSAQ